MWKWLRPIRHNCRRCCSQIAGNELPAGPRVGLFGDEPVLPRPSRGAKGPSPGERRRALANEKTQPKRKGGVKTDLEDVGQGVGMGVIESDHRAKSLLRRPTAALPRKHELFIRHGPPMTIEDLARDAPSIFVESRRKIEDVLERRMTRPKAPEDVTPDTPFWRQPVKKKKAVKWQDEDPTEVSEVSEVFEEAEDQVHFSAASPVVDPLKGIVDLRRDGSSRQRRDVALLAPEKVTSQVINEEGVFDNTKMTSPSAASNAPTKSSNPSNSIISSLRDKAIEYARTGADPDIKQSLADALSFQPGAERMEKLKEMRNCNEDFESLVTSGKASLDNFNALIRAKGVQGRMSDALKLADTMHANGFEPNEGTFVSLLVGAAAKKDAELARQLFLKMREQLISPTVKSYAALIKAHTRAGDLTAAFALLRKMEDERLEPNVIVYTVLIDGLVTEGHLKKAWETFHTIRTWKLIQPDEVLFTVMIKACAKEEEAEKALNMLDDLRISGLHPTDLTYGEVIHALASRPDYARKCFDFYNQMRAEDMPLTRFIFRKLLQACKTLGDIHRAQVVVQDIHEYQQVLDSEMYCHLIGVFGTAMRLQRVTEAERHRNLRSAWHVLASARQLNVRLDMQQVLNEVLAVYIAGGFSQHAADMLPHYASFGVEPNAKTYYALLEMLGRDLKDVGRFFALWDRMGEVISTPPEDMYHLALDIAVDSRSARRTVAVLEEMLQASVFPSPQLTERLAKVGRNVIQIHHLIGKFVKLQQETRAATAKRDQALLISHLDEHNLRLAEQGLTTRRLTVEQEVRAKHFASKKKRGLYRKPWLPKSEYIEKKRKGGEAYAQYDRPRPNLLSA